MTAAPSERIVRFGVRQGLAGIISTSRDTRAGAPHVVLVNAGIVHRVGPGRLYVDIARRLATEGYPVLRFDLSGLGDSDAASGGASLSESAVSDIRAAFDFLESSRKSTSFILCGLCAGANHSLLTTFVDSRVVGAVLIEPSVGRTWRSRIIHLGRRLRHMATWRALLTLRHPVWRRSIDRLRRTDVVQSAHRQREARQPSAREIHASLEQVIDRGVQLMLVFTGDLPCTYNYRGQLFDLLPGLDFRQQLRLEFMPETDHIVSDGPGRAKLLQAIAGWVTERFSVAGQSREETG